MKAALASIAHPIGLTSAPAMKTAAVFEPKSEMISLNPPLAFTPKLQWGFLSKIRVKQPWDVFANCILMHFFSGKFWLWTDSSVLLPIFDNLFSSIKNI